MGFGQSEELEEARQRLLRSLEGHRDVFPRVWTAFTSTPRHLFVPAALIRSSYEDRALPIREGVTISQPSLVLRMTELLDPQPKDTVLEIGTGTGYQTAILAQLCERVFTIELDEELLLMTMDRLRSLGFTNIEARAGDGAFGWHAHAPYRRILVAAASRSVPSHLLSQLSDDQGKMVLPVGKGESQELLLITKDKGQVKERKVGPVVFVPMRTLEGSDD